ncbi:MAG: hypothetical protein IJY25_04600 [Bacilli bacterium]|nr:hypothetical protein [Bacilli bacterium]
MELRISAKLQGIFETYNIFVDDEKIIKVRGNKTTVLSVSDEEHTVQLKGGSGKSSVIKISKPTKKDECIDLSFITHYSRAFKEGYFELIED